MTAGLFRRYYGKLPEAMLLLSGQGRIVEANSAARELLRVDAGGTPRLQDLVSDSPEKVNRLLEIFRRTADLMPGALTFRDSGSGLVCRVEGAVADPADADRHLLVRIFAREEATHRFRLLNERIEALNHEVLKRVRIEGDLHSQSEWLQATLASIRDAVIATDAAGKVSFLNNVAATLTGWDADDAAGHPVEDVFAISDEDTGVAVENSVRRILRAESIPALTNHTKLTARDGRQVPIDHSAGPIRDAGGRIAGVVLVFRDIGARREAEREAQRSFEHFRLIADSAPVMIWMSGLDKQFTWFSKPWLDFAGRPMEEELGSRWTEHIHPDDLQRCLDTYSSAFDDRREFRIEYRVRRHDGELRWVLNHGKPRYGHDDEFCGYIGGCVDITDRKALEEAVHNREQIYRAVGESINYGVWICEPDGRNRYASESFLKLVGMTQEECSDFGWGSVLHPDDRDKTIAAWKDCVQREGNWNMEHRFRGTNGRYHWLLARGVPVRDEKGKVVCWAGINLDIDEVKAGEERLRGRERDLRAANEALVRANADLQQFAFAASHDLQEPLRMITAYSQLLLRAYRERDELEADLAVVFITEGTDRMRELLDDLLSYTQLSAEERQRLERVDLKLVLAEVTGNLKTAIEANEALVSADPLPVAPGHKADFVQLFQNLIENAIKYRSDDAPRIHIHIEEGATEWRIAVADNGIGIAQYHRQIFGVFRRLHGKQVPGTGIGLAICQRVVERHGGRIWVESSGTGGTAFHFTLPKAEGPGA